MSNVPADNYEEIVDYSDGHLRVLGPPASGKTALLLERYRRAAPRAAIVTYTRENRDALTDELLAKHSARFGKIRVYTYHALAREIIGAVFGTGRRLVGELEEAVVLRQLLRGIEEKLSSDYRNTLHSSAFQNRLLGVVNTLLQNGVETETHDASIAAAGSGRAHDLLTVYFVFLDYLRTRSLYTYYDAAWRAAEIATERPDLSPLGNVDVLFVDDFQDVDGGQYALIKALAPPGGRLLVNVFGDPTGARFRTQGTTDRYLLEVFPRDYEPRDVRLGAGCANDEVIGPVVDRLLTETLGKEPARMYARRRAKGDIEASLAIAEDETAEAAYVAGRAAELVRTGRYRPDEIAVAAREKHRYETTLQVAFRDRGLVLDTGRRPQHPFEFFVYSLLRLLDDPGSETARNAVAGSPYFGSLKTVYAQSTGGETGEDDASAVETVRGAIHSASVGQSGAFELTPLLDHWIRPVLADAVERSAAGEAPDQSDLLWFLGGLADEWRMYDDAVASTRGRRTIREFLALSRTLAAGARDSRSAPRRSGRVGFYSVGELSSRRFPVVFIVGCSELLFPSQPPTEEYVPYGSLQQVLRGVVTDRPVELPLARSGGDFLRDEYALMLTAISRSGHRLELTAPEQHRGESRPAPASVLKDLPDNAVILGISRDPSVPLRFSHAAATLPQPTGHLVGDLWSGVAPVAREVQRAPGPLSPSALKTFSICSRKYFYSKVLRFEKEKTTAMTFGSLFHHLMQRVSQDNRTHESLRSAIESDQLEGYIEDTVSRTEDFSGAAELERESARHHLREMVMRVLELDGARIGGYRIEHTELKLNFEHNGWRFRGIADRIDEVEQVRKVVIDYKTGKLPMSGKTIRRNALAGYDKPEDRLWQVPIYTRGFRPDVGEYPEAFCYYVIKPDGKDAVVGLAVGGEHDAARVAASFGAKRMRFGHITPAELEESLNEAAAVARDVFADREEFVRTEDRERCTMCEFHRICERAI